MDEKVTRESFKAYRDWQRYILAAMTTKPKLTDKCARPTLVAYCLAMATHGTNGLGCYASDARIARELGMYDYKSVSPYRNEALRLGWFTPNGKRHGRAKELDISIPSDSSEVTDTRHDSTAEVVADCPACEPYLDDMRAGKLTLADLRVIHRRAIGRAYEEPEDSV